MEMEMEMQQEAPPEKWEYIENRTAMIRATPQMELRPHWYGAHDAEEIRAVVRRGVNAANNYDTLVEFVRWVVVNCAKCAAETQCHEPFHAYALTVLRECGESAWRCS